MTKEKTELLNLIYKLETELDLHGIEYTYVHDFMKDIENYKGESLVGLVTTVSILVNSFPVSDDCNTRMQTERFVNRVLAFISSYL